MIMRFVLTGILVLVAAGVGFLTYDWYRTSSGTRDAYGVPFKLTAANGETVTEQSFRGQPNAVFFGFTHCPEVCPTTLFELDGWLKTLGDDGANIRAWFVTVDPERDTAELMASYVGAVSDRITGVTGDPKAIAEMVKGFAIYARKVPLEGDDYTMDHTASILLLDSKGRLFGTIAYGENAGTAMEKLKRLAAG